MLKWHEFAAAADEVEAKGQIDLALQNRKSATKTALEEAVRIPEAEARRWLSSVGVGVQLDRILAFANEHPEHTGKIDYTDQIDLALALGRLDIARTLCRIAKPPFLAYWIEYRNAIAALLDGKPYRAPEALKVKGILATLVPNLKFAETLATGGDLESAVRDVDDAFERRQRDKRMEDPGSLDGCGRGPVQWNLRKAVLFAAAGRT